MSSCIICTQNAASYAFSINKNKFYQCDHCRTILPDVAGHMSLDNGIAEPKSVPRDAKGLEKLILTALKNRKAAKPYLVLFTEKEHLLFQKLTRALPPDTEFSHINKSTLSTEKKFGTIILLSPLSAMNEPNRFLTEIQQLLLESGSLLFFQPMIDSSQAKIMGKKWLEWRSRHAFYPARDGLHILLLNKGFDRIWFHKARYAYTAEYIRKRLKNAHGSLWFKYLAFLLLPAKLFSKFKFRLPSSHVIVSCQKAPQKKNPVLSIVLPVFNEKNTFEQLMKTLLAKSVEGLAREIIIIESNSTDGTRDLVKHYATHPDVKIIWQEKPRGKGYAVREGLAAATGDYVLIQDADLEYDVNDYDSLLMPLRNSQAMFVLGSRHTGSWRIREFNDAVATATVFNIGHIFFTWFVNFLTRQRMTDPFTMFKVLRRDALFGLNFACNRFDFDHELVIKLIRKGYQPLELPVNYRARSFAEGKKVSFIKDGMTWVYTDLKLRFCQLGIWPD